MDALLRHKLTHAATDYDRKQSTKRGYNIYALAHYLEACIDIEAAVDSGVELRRAITNATTGPLASALLRAVGLPGLTTQEARY